MSCPTVATAATLRRRRHHRRRRQPARRRQQRHARRRSPLRLLLPRRRRESRRHRRSAGLQHPGRQLRPIQPHILARRLRLQRHGEPARLQHPRPALRHEACRRAGATTFAPRRSSPNLESIHQTGRDFETRATPRVLRSVPRTLKADNFASILQDRPRIDTGRASERAAVIRGDTAAGARRAR